MYALQRTGDRVVILWHICVLTLFYYLVSSILDDCLRSAFQHPNIIPTSRYFSGHFF
jgi:hypothetical protein